MKPEQEWGNRLRGGDREALRPLMDAYGDDVIRTAALLLGDRYGAEDISQEVFWTVFRRIHQKSEKGSLRAWIMKITVNQCRAQMRKASWKRLFFRDQPWRNEISSIGTTETVALRVTLRDCIQKLSYAEREIIVLHYFQDWAIADISAVLGQPEGTVKSRLSRARSKLERILKESGWDHE
ncbi:RNA polymerase sigma factor [Paenibacillus dendritiformis]|uniref:RNA polymerase sigma factor n=1 Tax=Paenibacillus dendritiformis TaxID=130049 RepID=UPI0018CD0ACA|nr:sigma-70 family RNA polymerase sigma factor [Paenibacillus dendritiformis]